MFLLWCCFLLMQLCFCAFLVEMILWWCVEVLVVAFFSIRGCNGDAFVARCCFCVDAVVFLCFLFWPCFFAMVC